MNIDARAAFVATHNARTDYRRPIVMPTASTWAVLFQECIPWQVDKLHNVIGLSRPIPTIETDDYYYRRGRRRHKIAMSVGPYLTTSHHGASAAVIPTEAAVAAIAANTIVVERDSLFFKLTEWAREPGEPVGSELCLVTADHNQIIGAVWLAVIPVSEIPAWLRTREAPS